MHRGFGSMILPKEYTRSKVDKLNDGNAAFNAHLAQFAILSGSK